MREHRRYMMAEKVWTLEQAVTFIHELQTCFLHDSVPYYVGLTGSVLYGASRSSEKDLDIILYPTSSREPDEQGVKAALRRFGLTLLYDRDIVMKRWMQLKSTDEKHVEVWSLGKKRVDIFFLK